MLSFQECLQLWTPKRTVTSARSSNHRCSPANCALDLTVILLRLNEGIKLANHCWPRSMGTFIIAGSPSSAARGPRLNASDQALWPSSALTCYSLEY